MDPRLQSYLYDGQFHNVSGACDGQTMHRLCQFHELQARDNIQGDLVEIGVAHGRLFILLALLAGQGAALAIDVFEVDRNYDPTGGTTTLDIVKQNVHEHVGDEDCSRYLVADSLYIDPSQLRQNLPSGRTRIFSIDGAHSHFHTVHDMKLAEAVLAPGGIVMVDDITNSGWPGVMEGVARYFLLNSERRLFPFMMGGNKLWLTSYDYHGLYLNFAQDHVQIDEAAGFRKRTTNFFGTEMVGGF